MPRIAKPPASNLPRIRQDFGTYLKRERTTPTAFAKQHGVDQSTVQRFLAGRTKSVTSKMKVLLAYAKIDCNMRIADRTDQGLRHPRIHQALDKVWDGQERTAEILATLIESVGPVIVQANRNCAK